MASIPDLPQRTPARVKASFYLRADLAKRAEKLARYTQFLGVPKGEALDVILTVGLDNEMEVMRVLREKYPGIS